MSIFKDRSNKLEYLDLPTISEHSVRRSLSFMTVINRYFGGAKPILDWFDSIHTPESFTVADLGVGSGDIPYSLVQWARSKNKKIKVLALDINPTCLSFAREKYSHPWIHSINQSAFELADLEPIDYAMTSMFAHHLPDKKIIDLLRVMQTKCKRGFIVNDLMRSPWAYVGVALLGAFSFNNIILHDATLSVARSFKRSDYARYLEKAGIERGFKIEEQPFFRLVMKYEKSN